MQLKKFQLDDSIVSSMGLTNIKLKLKKNELENLTEDTFKLDIKSRLKHIYCN